MECQNCGRSLDYGARIVPWEEGSRLSAYLVCPLCGHKSIAHGFGKGEDHIPADENEAQNSFTGGSDK